PVLLAGRGGKLVALNPPGEAVLAALADRQSAVRRQIVATAELALKGMAAGPVTVALQMDGAVVLFEVSARPAGGHAAVICRDVSAETSVREVLLESRQRYKQLVEIGADFIWECDETGAFSFVSEPGAFGFPPDRLIGRQPARFVVPSEDG